MTRLYISGPVTGIAHDNAQAFLDAQFALRSTRYETFIPHNLVSPGDTHETAMLLCINELTERDTRRAFSALLRRPGHPPRMGAVGGREA